MGSALRRAQKNEFVDVVLDARFTHDGVRDEAAGRKTDREAVRTRSSVHVIRELSAAASIHEFGYHGGLAGNVLFQIRYRRSHPHVGGAARRVTVDDRNRFPLVERRLRESGGAESPQADKSQPDPRST